MTISIGIDISKAKFDVCVYGLSVIDRFLRLKNLLLDKHACTLEYDLESEVFLPESRLDSDRDCATQYMPRIEVAMDVNHSDDDK